MPRGNPDKIKDFYFTTETASEYGKKGQKKSTETKRRNKLLRETICAYLKAKPDGKKTVQEGIIEALIERALRGDTKAFELIRDTIGQKPFEKELQKIDHELTIKWQS